MFQDGNKINMSRMDSFLGNIRVTGVGKMWTRVMMGEFVIGHISLIEIGKSKKIHFGYLVFFMF